MSLVSEEVLLGRVRRESEARAAELAGLRADLAALGAQIEERIDRLSARFRSRLGGGAGTDSSALIESIRRVVAGEGYALAEIVDRLEARVGDNAAATAEQFLRTRVTADSALAEWGVNLTARINQNYAEASTRLTAFANTTGAMAEQVTALESTVYTPGTGLVAAVASATSSLSTQATAVSALAGRTVTLESQVQAPFGGLLARVQTVEMTKVDANGARSEASSVVSASLASSATGSIGLAVTTAASAYVTPFNTMGANWGVKIDDTTGRVLGRITLDATAETSTLDFEAGTIRLWNGASDVAPFTLDSSGLRLTNVVVDTLKAGIQITTPKILGSELKLTHGCILCADTSDHFDTSLIRVQGGGGDSLDRSRGGQLDCFGNEHGVAPGSIYITPGDVSGAEVRIRGRDGADRIAVRAIGHTEILGPLEVTGGSVRSTNGVNCGGGTGGMVAATSGRLYLATGATPRWFISDGSGDLNCVGNYSIKKESPDNYSMRLVMHSGAAVEFGESGGNLTYRINGGTPRTLTFT